MALGQHYDIVGLSIFFAGLVNDHRHIDEDVWPADGFYYPTPFNSTEYRKRVDVILYDFPNRPVSAQRIRHRRCESRKQWLYHFSTELLWSCSKFSLEIIHLLSTLMRILLRTLDAYWKLICSYNSNVSNLMDVDHPITPPIRSGLSVLSCYYNPRQKRWRTLSQMRQEGIGHAHGTNVIKSTGMALIRVKFIQMLRQRSQPASRWDQK